MRWIESNGHKWAHSRAGKVLAFIADSSFFLPQSPNRSPSTHHSANSSSGLTWKSRRRKAGAGSWATTRSSGWRAWRPTQSSLGGSGWHDEVRCRFAVRRLDFFLFSFCFLFVFFLFSFCFLFVFLGFLGFSFCFLFVFFLFSSVFFSFAS